MRVEADAVAAPIPARMLVKLAAAPSTSVRHGERFVTYNITLRDIRDALYPPEFLDGRPRQSILPSGRVWPRVREAIRIINHEARIPLLDPEDRLRLLSQPASHQRELRDGSTSTCR